ncbi:restriction endonuclease subunit S [candidate division KSB1 bacterium]|nr:restriction endonuclease subunit S [candidate division KSB1 bacterium]
MGSDSIFTEYGQISAKFDRAKLIELTVKKDGIQTGPFGTQLHKEDYVEKGTPIITVEHLNDNKIIHQDTPYVSDEDKERLSKYELQEGDIVFSRVGSVDRRALVRKEESGWLFSGRCLRVRVNKKIIDPIYLSYFLGMEGFKSYIRNIAVGATMPSINTKILSDVLIYFPKLEQQKQIGNILFNIDKKIELNHQINHTLEQIAQTIFKSWFVDFDPVKAKIAAKAEGRDPERAAMAAIAGKTETELDQLSPEQLQQLAATAALFPDELVESELGMIPMGWEVIKIGDVVQTKSGGTPSRKRSEYYDKGILNWIKSKELNNSFVIGSEEKITDIALERSSAKLLPPRSILIAMYGATVGQIGILAEESTCNQAICALLPCKELPYPYLYIYFLRNKDNIIQKAVGSAQQNISQVLIRDLKILLPPIQTTSNFYKGIEPLFEKILSNIIQNSLLEKTRDSLLPKLLSGEIELNVGETT